MKIIPADDVLAELRKKAEEYEEQAQMAPDGLAARLRGKAKECCEWIAALTSRKWTS
jgi:hypothetical protein